MQCKKPLCLRCCGLAKSRNNIIYPGFFGGRQENWEFGFLGMCRVLNTWLQDGICSCAEASPGTVSQGNALQPGCVTVCLFGVQCWGHLCWAPGLCWAQEAVSEPMVQHHLASVSSLLPPQCVSRLSETAWSTFCRWLGQILGAASYVNPISIHF